MNNVLTIGNKAIGKGQPPFIIAEAGANTNSSIDLALSLVEKAKDAGADAIKFQTFKANILSTKKAPKFWVDTMDEWENDVKPYGYQYDEYKLLDGLSARDYKMIKKKCDELDIVFFSTPFDFDSVDLLEEIGVPLYKIASADITYYDLLRYVGNKKKPIILSTGASTLDEVKEAVRVIKDTGNNRIALLQCTLHYPCKHNEVHINAMKTLKNEFQDCVIGLSDHSLGILAPIVAVANGAQIIEKHFTIDKTLDKSSDHFMSVDTDELRDMVSNIKIIPDMLGNPVKQPDNSEELSVLYSRRSLVTTRNIKSGEKITEEMVIPKRPGTGIPTKELEYVAGRIAKEDIGEDEVLTYDNFHKPRIVAIVQVRMGSTRLPGKSLMTIGDKPLIQHVYERTTKSKFIDKVVLATSDTEKDDILETFGKEKGWNVFRGPENDLIARFLGAAEQFKAEQIVRICADNPFIDPEILDELIKSHLSTGVDYTENLISEKTNYPSSVGAEIFTIQLLENEIKNPKRQKDVFVKYLTNAQGVKTNHQMAPKKLSYPQIKIDIDTKEDIERIRKIYPELIKTTLDFKTKEIVDLFKQKPEMFK